MTIIFKCFTSNILRKQEYTMHEPICTNFKLINISYISIHDGHGLIMMYDIQMHLDFFNTSTINGLKYIAITFNINAWKIIYIVYVSWFIHI
jgi:hypothetical protein